MGECFVFKNVISPKQKWRQNFAVLTQNVAIYAKIDHNIGFQDNLLSPKIG
jgi:hypothetical protein